MVLKEAVLQKLYNHGSWRRKTLELHQKNLTTLLVLFFCSKEEAEEPLFSERQPFDRFFSLVNKKKAYDRTWTGDLSLTKGMLYQLSYIGFVIFS